MKKSRVLSVPTKLRDLSFDDFYDDDETTNLKSERLNAQKWRQFKHEAIG